MSKPTTVYAVVSGEYSDYGVHAVFLFEMNTLTEVAFTEKNVVDTVLYAALGIKEDS